MEVDEIQSPQPQSSCKYSRVNSANGRIDCSKIGGGGGSGGGGHDNGEENELDEINQRRGVVSIIEPAAAAGNGSSGGIGGDMIAGGSNRFGRQWQHSSRIIRVSRASGGKDRHSKVWTAKGPRDRRVRLSVTTAIQFYDLQDRLGYDQPSKAVEWLIKAAQEAINELPALNTASFPPETPRQLSDERRGGGNGVESADVELDGDPNFSQNQNQNQNQNQQHMGAKLGCSTSNNSETSKGSGLSLSRSEIRVKARERARERMAKEKDRDGEPSRVNVGSHQHHNNHHQQQHHQQQNVSSMPQTTSFTQLLTAGMNNLNESNNAAASSTPSPHHHGSAEVSLFHKHSRGGESNNNNNNQWLSTGSSTTPMADYFGTGLMGLSSSRAGQIQLGHNTSSLPPVMTITSFGGSENQHQSHDQLHHHHQHFPFLPDQHLIQVANTASRASDGGGSASDYNLNFTVSSSPTSTTSGLAAGFYNRGTLQSNSPSLLPYLQRFSATDGSSLPFFLGSAAVSSASPAVENHHNHHHHQQQFQPPGLQLCYGDGGWPSDQKGKGKN